jgi:hypothetical protein
VGRRQSSAIERYECCKAAKVTGARRDRLKNEAVCCDSTCQTAKGSGDGERVGHIAKCPR